MGTSGLLRRWRFDAGMVHPAGMTSKFPRASTGIMDAAASDDGHPEGPATVQDTRAALLKRSKRGFAPVNKVFVQAPAGSESSHGMLATFVTAGT